MTRRQGLRFACANAVTACAVSAMLAATADAQTQTRSLAPVTDCSIVEGGGSEQSCAKTTLRSMAVKKTRMVCPDACVKQPYWVPARALLQFDLSSIPQGAVVTSAKLKVSVLSGPGEEVDVRLHPLTRSWGAGVSWTHAATGQPWTSAGGDFAAHVASIHSSGSLVGRREWTVTSTVAGWTRAPAQNRGLMIKTSFEAVGAGLEMASSEHATASLRPVLEVTYGEPQVLNAKVYIDEPSIPLTLLGEEWRVVGGIQERWVDDDSIVTTEAVSCTTSATGLCREYRQRSRHSAVTPTDADSFTRYRGTSVEDPRVPRGAGELLSWADDVAGESPDGSGPIGSVKFAWQTLPPGAGTTYTLYESDSGFHEEPGTAVDGPNGEVDTPVIKEFRERLVIDTATRLPIRWTAFERASGELVSRRIYSYAAALQPRSAFPADFFTVARPAAPDTEKIVEFSDAPPSAGLAPATTLDAGSLCFDDAISARLTERPLPSEVPKPDGSHLRAVQYSGVYANYQLRDAAGRCGAGRPDVVVRSSPATGALGRAWKQSYIELGDPMQLRRPMSAARSLQPAAVDRGETVWLLPLRNGEQGFYAEEGDTALVVTGPVTARDVPAVLEGLEVR